MTTDNNEEAAVREAARRAREAEAMAEAARKAREAEVEPPPIVPPAPPPEIPEVPEPTGWRPDFTADDPWEGMPQEYVEREAAAYEPTYEQPLPPSQRTPEGIAAREVAPEASREFIAIRDLSDPEDYDRYQELQEEQQFMKAVELGLIPEGSKYVPIKPGEWGYYTPEQIAEMEAAEAAPRMVSLRTETISTAAGDIAVTPAEAEELKAILDRTGTLTQSQIDMVLGRRIGEDLVSLADVEAALAKLEPYKVNGGYDIQRAFAEGKGADVSEASALGIFTPGQVVVAQFGAIKAGILEREAAKLEAIIADIKETAPGVITTEEKVTTIDGVTSTTTVHSVVLEEALLAGVSESTLIELGYTPEQVEKAADFVDANTFLPNTSEWVPNNVITSVREQSEYGYDILINQGVGAYNTAIDDALTELEPFKRITGYPPEESYGLKPAVAAGVEKDTLSLLFPKDAVDKAWLVKMIGEEAVPEVEAKPISGLPTGLVAALPVMGAIAVAEPTFIGEVVVGTVILGTAAWYATIGKDIKWGALWDDITSAFRTETGREPTEAEVVVMETTAASIISAEAVPVVDMPTAIATKAYEAPPWKPGELPIITMPQLIVTKGIEPVPWKPPTIPRIEPIEPPPIPVYEAPPWKPPAIPVVEMPQIIAAQGAVTTAEEELEDVIIKPKIMTPSELDRLWGLTKTEEGLVALDEAVGEAYTSGEIDADTLRVYGQARTNYLTKKGILDSATETASSQLELPKAETVEAKNALLDALIAHNTVLESRKIWAEYQARAIGRPVPVTAEQIAEQKAFTEEGIRLSAEAAENQRLWESTLKVYYDAVGETHEAYLAKLEAINQAINKYIGEYQPLLVTDVSSLIASATQLAISDLQEQANKAATEAYQQALIQGLTQAQAQVAAQTVAQNAIQAASETATQQAIKTATQTAVETATQTLTKTAAKTATQTLTSTATQTAVNTAVNTAVATATATMTQTAVSTATAVRPIIPIPVLPPSISGEELAKKPPKGSVAWRQGLFWIIMPPPYDEKYYSKKAPAGAYKFATGEDSAYKTIQVLNGIPKKDILGVDIGIAIVDIRRKGKELTIHFKQDVEDIYKGKEVKEPIQTFKRPNTGLKYHTDENGKLVIDEEPRKRVRKPKPIPAETLLPRRLELPEPTRKEKPEKELASVTDRYYLGHKLPDSNVKVDL